MCVPADRWGSDRALGGEVWGGEGLDDWQSVLTGTESKEGDTTENTQKHAER